MSTQPTQRPKWEIDRILGRLIGEQVRVAAKSFSPGPCHGRAAAPLLPVRELFLPDNSQPSGLPVFFEGRLRQFEQQIGAVFVCLDPPASRATATDGPVCFRGQMAVILRGPALIELAFPFQVERLPADLENYWRDLRAPRAQFEFPFSADELKQDDTEPAAEPDESQCSRTVAPRPLTSAGRRDKCRQKQTEL